MRSNSRGRWTSILWTSRQALRHVIRRRGRGLCSVLLVSLAAAVSVVMLCAGDAFLFRAIPFPNEGRLLVLRHALASKAPSDFISAPELLQWAEQTDLFREAHAHRRAPSAYLTIDGITDAVRSEFVTSGLFTALGVQPIWGRLLESGAEGLISERLARRLSKNPATLIGQLLALGTDHVVIVGIMPARFRYPSAEEQIWRPLDVLALASQPGAERNAQLRNVFVLADGLTQAEAERVVEVRGAVLAREVLGRTADPWQASRMSAVHGDPRAGRLFSLLVSISFCLLVLAVFNTASLELLNSLERRPEYSIQRALGAPTSILVSTGLVELLLLATASAAVALLATWIGLEALPLVIPQGVVDAALVTPQFSGSAVFYVLLVCGIAWTLVGLPTLFHRRRSSESTAVGNRATAGPSTMLLRRLFVTTQVGCTVILVSLAFRDTRAYLASALEDRGFETDRLLTVEIVLPPGDEPSVGLQEELLERFRSNERVESASRTWSLPPDTDEGVTGDVFVDQRDTPTARLKIATYAVTPSYFDVLGLRLRDGRWFSKNDPVGKVVIDEALAVRLWPEQSAVGRTFRVGRARIGGAGILEVAGVASHVRPDIATTLSGQDVVILYTQLAASEPALSFVVRLKNRHAAAAIVGLARTVAPRAVVRASFVNDRYASLYGDLRLVALLGIVVSVLAVAVAGAGLFAVMSYFAKSKSKEFALRLACGAMPSDIRGLVLKTVSLPTAAGIVVGSMTVFLGSGLSLLARADTSVGLAGYALAAGVVVSSMIAAAWRPMTTAGRIQAAEALRQVE